MRFSLKSVFILLVINLLVVCGCYNDHPSNEQTFVCTPGQDDCGEGAECIKAGGYYVCSSNQSCRGGCTAPEACVNGTCQCFTNCEDKTCGDDGCGGSCGSCPDGESWWCDAGTCKDDCAGLECGKSPSLKVDCGTCSIGDSGWCDAGTCKDDCAGLECGDSPNRSINCGSCPVGDSWWCNAGSCQDDCATQECGTSQNIKVNCGTCRDGWLCESGTCKDDCAGLECGESPHLAADCGECSIGDSWWCDAGTCKDDCAGLECGRSPVLNLVCWACSSRSFCNAGKCEDECGITECGTSAHGINCGSCQDDSWCDAGFCIHDCAGLWCGTSPHLGLNCGTCNSLSWCDAGVCKIDCAGLECGRSPHLNAPCGTCSDRFWCNAGTCEDDCGTDECGTTVHGVSCGTCPAGSYVCDAGKCKDECAGMECGESFFAGWPCGTCSDRFWCNAGTCEDDCGTDECGTTVHGVSCGTCQDGWWCDAGTCKDDCAGLQCGLSPVLSIDCGICWKGSSCIVGQCEVDSVLIPAGSFWMGCNTAVDTQCSPDESPYHQVTLSGYYIDKTEVTQMAYGACVDAGICSHHMDDGSCNYSDGNAIVPGVLPLQFRRGDYPMTCVDWNQSKTYCEWAGKRLPTEAEWEKAARGVDGRKYPWGNEPVTCEYAVMSEGGYGCGTNGLMSACSKSPAGDSPYELCDMSGSVWEWTADWYDSSYYTSSPDTDPVGPASGSNRIWRGASFYNQSGSGHLRVSDRAAGDPSYNVYNVGFRCVEECIPDCSGRQCGNDGCGGSCGICNGSDVCVSGNCVWQAAEYTPQCTEGMCLIPEGSFWMGCNAAVDDQCGADESPYHQIVLSEYYIDKMEVTAGAYSQCVTAGACTAPTTVSNYCNWNVVGKKDHPVNCIDWFQSQTYCEWAGKRLPTEAQWEKAARGTDGRKYPWGNQDATCEYAVMNESGIGCGTDSSMTVCSKSPAGDSPYGLCDMSGNVWEWLFDWYGEDYYSSSPGTEPTGPTGGSFRVLHGGSLFDGVDGDLRASYRTGRDPSASGAYGRGFRCVGDSPCSPDCTNRECGDNGCGGSCGGCEGGYECNLDGMCVPEGMALIPAGSFWMGCNSVVDTQCASNERPYHQVTLSDYYMDETEVTVSAYKTCVDAGTCTPPVADSSCNWNVAGKEDHPVNCINWDQSKTYCEWAGKRLPTEAEWEKAARGTDGRKYPWGTETATCEYAVMDDGGYGCGTDSTWAVCGKSSAEASPYKLCDMSGNVWEWVWDWHDSDYYTSSPASNPTGPDSGTYRVFRGGGFYSPDDSLRASERGYDHPSSVSKVVGFRCAKDAL